MNAFVAFGALCAVIGLPLGLAALALLAAEGDRARTDIRVEVDE
jgi:hypothetical protein